MHDYVVTCVNPRTGEFKPATLALNDLQLARAKRFELVFEPSMTRAIPEGFMPCETFATP
ncbi:hypothetical protein [Bradyrhizobium guangdongense]|uniref:Uncharacterized protein n=1 Tax=Bradyrhizobium guangdongense TaxID=1325090 RepID=A0A410V6W1_9BRAD|nr:hypothetical protein [Bradyrhizobium guangdongense]QAU39443.1 hypothetical protein X265_18575 [Bradyrhizobium guangdongense]QOZ60502.1 hypothetical protein XH86_18580 [Bradyrhizobium guangdongense]GGI23789.1 hypothetical protein GCM10010987_26140 [Bradyrhizobium guangdongense]